MIKIITSWDTLIKLAHKVGRAKKYGNREDIVKAKADLKAYEEIVRKSDAVRI